MAVPAVESHVWIWLPGAEEPVLAGVARERGRVVRFAYDEGYRERPDAIALFDAELPLSRRGFADPPAGLGIAGCLNDAGADSWGERAIRDRLAAPGSDELGRLTYLAEAGSDRPGALDFQPSAREYVRRGGEQATLEQMLDAAERIETRAPVPAALERALRAGSSVSGARPKALLSDGDRHLVAKFSSLNDTWPVVRGEYVAMRLAARCGLDAAAVQLVQAGGRDVLLVERFDRVRGTRRRRAVLSALTLLGLPDSSLWTAAYGDLAEVVRRRFTAPARTRRELFSRMVFNVLCGNTDDHARNHAAFWDGHELTLTPAYDICPQPRVRAIATQAMRLGARGDPYRLSDVGGCVDRAGLFGLTREDAEAIAGRQLQEIDAAWDEVCDEARLPREQREALRGIATYGAGA